jgi:dihydrofolate reductase
MNLKLMNRLKITIHMVSSLDGFIAKKDNNIDWFETTDTYANGSDAPDATAFLKSIDCYVMGSHTYELALELSKSYGWPYGDTPTIVLTHRNLPKLKPHIQFYKGELHKMVEEQLKPYYKNVWIAGGAKLANDFFLLNLADEIRQSILPIVLGDGIPFWIPTDKEKALHLKSCTAYKNGMVDLCYAIKK